MKLSFITVFVLISSSVWAQRTLNSNDSFKPNQLDYDIDGYEEWVIPRRERAEAFNTFKNKCENEIPNLVAERLENRGMNSEHFGFTASVYQLYFSGYGKMYRCRMTAQILYPEEYQFQFIYSDIITQKPEETCTKMVQDLDLREGFDHIFDRRIYFEAVAGRRVNTFTACQVLQIKVLIPPFN